MTKGLTPQRKLELIARLSREIKAINVDELGRAEVLEAFDRSGELVALDAGGKKNTAAERARLMGLAAAGEITRLVINATVFTQHPTKPNRKYSRLKPGAMQALATSFVGRPMLKDHNLDLDARGGTILESKLERAEVEGGTLYTIRQKIELVKPWAILGVLDGTIDAWSIQFGRTADGEVQCSVHGTAVFTKCYCWRGELVNDKIVEFVYTKAEGYESSAVTVPAVDGTSVDTISALRVELGAQGLDVSSLACILGSDKSPKGSSHMDTALIAATLGLKTDASVDSILDSIRKLTADAKVAQDQTTIARDQLKIAEAARDAALGLVKVERDARQAETVESTIEALKAAGKVAPGGKTEVALRSMATSSFELFTAQTAEMLEGVSVTPAGAPRQTRVVTKPIGGDATTLQAAMQANPKIARFLNKAGISMADAEKFGTRVIEKMMSDGEDDED